jgi:hypothetical protein
MTSFLLTVREGGVRSDLLCRERNSGFEAVGTTARRLGLTCARDATAPRFSFTMLRMSTVALASRKVWMVMAAALTAAAAFYEKLPAHRPPFLGNVISEFGFVPLGPELEVNLPLAIPPWAQVTIGMLLILCGAASVAVLWLVRRSPKAQWQCDPDLWPFLVLGLPFAAATLLGSVVRENVFDRYLIPVIPVAVIALLRILERGPVQRIPVLAWATLIIFAAFGVAMMHDAFAIYRARVKVADALRARGVPRSEILGGFEYDSWTQLELAGHINNDPVRYPRNGYQPIKDCSGPDSLQLWYRELVPEVRARYFIIEWPIADVIRAPFPPVRFRTWLPARKREAAAYQLPDGDVLECR